MADFLMIVPEGYTEVDGTMFFETTGVIPESLVEVFESGAYWELFPLFEMIGVIVDGQRIADYKVFNTGGGNKIWIKIEADI